jgi:hypothetical protein
MLLDITSLQVPLLMIKAFLTLLALIALDTFLGFVSALVKGSWNWTAVGRFIETSVLPYVGGLLALALLALIQDTMMSVFYTSVAAASLKLVSDIVIKISNLGIKVQLGANVAQPPILDNKTTTEV